VLRCHERYRGPDWQKHGVVLNLLLQPIFSCLRRSMWRLDRREKFARRIPHNLLDLSFDELRPVPTPASPDLEWIFV